MEKEQREEKRRRALTEYETLKLKWYRNERDWIDNIKDRKIVKDRFGNRTVFSQGQVVPMQPKELWPKPKQQQ